MSITRQGRYTLAKMSVFSKNRQACTIHVTIIFPFLLKVMLAGDICEFLLQLNLRKTQGLGSVLKALRPLTPLRDLHLLRL